MFSCFPFSCSHGSVTPKALREARSFCSPQVTTFYEILKWNWRKWKCGGVSDFAFQSPSLIASTSLAKESVYGKVIASSRADV